MASLERCAHTVLCLVQDLQSSTNRVSALTVASRVHDNNNSNSNNNSNKNGSSTKGSTTMLPSLRTPLEEDTERAQFLMKLAPRIRRLEADTISSLTLRMEQTIGRLRQLREGKQQQDQQQEQSIEGEQDSEDTTTGLEKELLYMLGHSMRGLALLGRGKEVENIFARVAIMYVQYAVTDRTTSSYSSSKNDLTTICCSPLLLLGFCRPMIWSKISMGRLDEGGSRGECAGLASLLDEILSSIVQAFSPLLQLAEVMFDVGPRMEVDLVTAGVWVPIATALVADAGIKMAVFSPGIASILQRNYLTLDSFLATLAQRLLKQDNAKSKPTSNHEMATTHDSLFFQPVISTQTIQNAQQRIYSHPKTAEFSKRWNLPIYYQLRFGDTCTRLNTAIENTRQGGWIAEVYTGENASQIAEIGFEIPFFLEVYDILLGLFRPDVILRPLTNRFLRGAVQLVGRSLAFISEGMEGKILFGKEPEPMENGNGTNGSSLPYPTRRPYCWGDSAQDVAAVAWELAILETTMAHDYVTTICSALETPDSTEEQKSELRSLVSEVLSDASGEVRPIVEKAWNEVIVKIMTEKCSGPLAAVKGVAATYRMTNRPPPSQASPFMATILRPLKEFDDEFSSRTPEHIGNGWKVSIVASVTERYAAAVEELITTVQKTEVALQNRRATRRAASAGMSDGDKAKLQLYLDFQEYLRHVQELAVDPNAIEGISKLETLTIEGSQLQK